MRSMTGFGSASRTRGSTSVTVEARSVNNRYLKVALRAPAVLSSREHEIEEIVRGRVSRGTVSVGVRLILAKRPVVVRMNEEAAAEYVRLLRELGEKAGVRGEPDLALVAGLPGVFSAEEVEEGLPEEEWEFVRDAVAEALDAMVAMREAEGENLKRDFAARAEASARLAKSLQERAEKVPAEHMERLEERVTRLLERRGVEVTESDLLRELAILSERADVTEEITRLESHVGQFRKALTDADAVGRRLEFLVQEMHREANTISAKASDIEMGKTCVELKIELDRLKEQVQNVE